MTVPPWTTTGQTGLAPGQGPLTEANLRALTAMQEQEYRLSSGVTGAGGVGGTGPTGSGLPGSGLTGSGRQSGDHTTGGGGFGSPNPPSSSKHSSRYRARA